MPIKGGALGAEIPGRTVEIAPRALLAYAAGIGATDAIFMDDARPGGIVAAPPFVVVLEWPVVGSAAYRDALGISATERLRGVHVLQDSRFHRPIRPGDRLTTAGRIVVLRATRAGTNVVVKLTTTDATGAAVVESFYGAIFRGIDLDGPGGALEDLPPLAAQPDVAPAGRATARVAIAETLPHVYTECSAIWNPIHTERAVALAAGLPDIILHGTCTWALAALRVLRVEAGGDPARLRRFAGRFGAMVLPGTSIDVDHARLDSRHVALAVRNAEGALALAQGIAEIG